MHCRFVHHGGLAHELDAFDAHPSRLQAYPEYCRSMINSAPDSFKTALVDLEKRHGKVRCREG